MEAVKGDGISYRYDPGERWALEKVAITIKKGEFAAILGCNGCGKSTLVKHLNALVPLQQGKLVVAEINLEEEKNIWELRRRCGMVFQNPDNQFVSSLVEEDIAFGLENYDTPTQKIPQKVHDALKMVGMCGFEKRAPHTLSGGQKQRVALAGVLAMEPDIIIFDEATSMLDPIGREEVLNSMKELKKLGKTVIAITHYVEEAVLADNVIVMNQGRILACGTAREVLTDRCLMQEAGLIPPFPVRLYYDLWDKGICLEQCPLTNQELVEELCRLN